MDLGFDIAGLCAFLLESPYRVVALQFPDEHIERCAECYDTVLESLNDDSFFLYVITDSSFGSSVDDISASHIGSDLIVYFGSDLSSSSGTLPVVVVPWRRRLEVEACCSALASHIGDTPEHVLVCFDPSYIHEAPGVTKQLQSMFPNTVFIVGRPPPCIDLASRSLENSDNAEDVCLVGGLLFRPSDLALPSLTLVYVGDKSEQLASIQLEYPQNAIVHINPVNKTCISLRGENSRIFRERYGGVVAVQEASVVGLVVGSMGIEGALVKEMLTRLQGLIMSAGKSYYTFVMGRLNEAKLCNFPEINVFCLLANDDNALVPPKTFHVPLVTPYELELGLGTRQWASKYMTSIRSVADSSTPVVVLSGDTVVLETKADGIASTDVNSDSISAYSSRDVVGFNSAAASLRRNFVGLAYDDAEKDDTSIHNGMFGIAQQYTPT